jgi:PAS domain-containing protein
MQLYDLPPERILQGAIDYLARRPATSFSDLDNIAAALYLTDPEGLITFSNKACIALAGRTPVVNRDRWCATWKLFTEGGEPLPHDRCPMAVAIREKRPVRDVAVIAERPDGVRVILMPYPTPLFDAAGRLTGAINLLENITARRVEELREQSMRCRRLASAIGRDEAAVRLEELAVKFDELVRTLISRH